MGLFNRKSGAEKENKKEKGGWRRPANTAFKQQRLKAWQPILTPKTVIPTLFIIGLIFAPIGALLIWGSSQVSEMTFDYTECERLTPVTNETIRFDPLPTNKYSYKLRAGNNNVQITPPRYAFIDNLNNDSFSDVLNKRQCILEFHVPIELSHSVFLYYKLTNFFQNHRRYVKSLNSDQLRGRFVDVNTLNEGDCAPLGSINNTAVYPCGLIANSMFNDTFYTPMLQGPTNPEPYIFSERGIAWSGEARKYTSNPIGPGGYPNYTSIVPPPNWALYRGAYNESNMPNLSTNEHFQNWMRTAGLPTFTKLYGRNDNDNMSPGIYRITIGLNFPVLPYRGTKSIVISTVSWIGGKNPFLGWAYVAAAGLFVLIAILGTARHVIKPRRLGDMSLLTWHR